MPTQTQETWVTVRAHFHIQSPTMEEAETALDTLINGIATRLPTAAHYSFVVHPGNAVEFEIGAPGPFDESAFEEDILRRPSRAATTPSTWVRLEDVSFESEPLMGEPAEPEPAPNGGSEVVPGADEPLRVTAGKGASAVFWGLLVLGVGAVGATGVWLWATKTPSGKRAVSKFRRRMRG